MRLLRSLSKYHAEFLLTRRSNLDSNIIFVAAVTSLVLALTWGGSTYAWSSGRVLAPLILGIAGIIAFLFVERSFVRYPTVPFDILRSRTTLLGYATTFLHSVVMMMIVYVLLLGVRLRLSRLPGLTLECVLRRYFLPTAYFQAAREFPPIRSGTALFSFCL